jgi:orotate phosphoribosyltransferase
MIARWARALEPQTVAGPTTGGIIVSYETARLLGTRAIFAEPVACAGPTTGAEGGREFRRGFTLAPGERVLVVDDVLTTGGSIRGVLDAVRRAGAQPVGVAVLVDRSGGPSREGDFGLPFFACLSFQEGDLPVYEPAACPLCAQGVPLTVT